VFDIQDLGGTAVTREVHRILVIADDENDLTLIQELLEQSRPNLSTRVEGCCSLRDAEKLLTNGTHDLLVISEKIHGMPGPEILAYLRRKQKIPPAVVLTENWNEHAMRQAFSSGAADYLHKRTLSYAKLCSAIRAGICLPYRRNHQQAAEDQLRKLSRAVEQSADLVVITDREGHIEYVNPAFEALTGYTREEVLGTKPELLKSGQQDRAFYKSLWETILSGNIFRCVLANKKKNGDLFYVEKTIAPVRDPSGKITHFISNDRDITERRKLEAQLLQAQKMDAVGQLAGGVAHDFNNLLMVISSYAELSLDTLTPENPLHHKLTEILKASRRAADLTRQLLAFSRKQIQALQSLDLNSIVKELGRMLPRLVGEHIRVTLKPHEKLGRINADPVQIEQIIINLATNARDAMSSGGELIIETANIHLDETYVHRRPMVPPGDYVLLTLSDSGTGIVPEDLPHIFEPFFTTKKKGEGTGLGLATVYGIIKQSGGFIWVYSEPGLGTTFKIYFPLLQKPGDQKAEIPRPQVEVPKGSETLLIVEDEDAVRISASEFLRGCGYTVVEARNGQHAIDVASHYDGTIHLMITDVVMPQMGGGPAALEISLRRPALKVLYISGYANPTLLHHGVCDGEPLFLQKPFTLRTLAQKIRQALSMPSTSISSDCESTLPVS
jgi:two-component system, cell cycle sensor histidine kinase and response regulator CckA